MASLHSMFILKYINNSFLIRLREALFLSSRHFTSIWLVLVSRCLLLHLYVIERGRMVPPTPSNLQREGPSHSKENVANQQCSLLILIIVRTTKS